MKVLVYIDQRDAKIKSAALEALTMGAKLAGSAGDCAAVIVGKGVSGLTSELEGYGADTVYTVDGDAFDKFNCMNHTSAVEAAIKDHDAKLVVGVASPMGRDLFPRLAARLDGGIVTDATEVALNGDSLTATKPMYAGKCLAKVELSGSAMQFVTLRPNTFPSEKAGSGSATAKALDVGYNSDSLTTVEVRKGKSEKPDLTEATKIISGGRAMANEENFKILFDCADVIGATVGASRAAVDSGYASHDMQVGQTGKVVNPNLYIACGISGSIQHMAGMRTSKTIVAINTDPDAPIFQIADYGIVADLFEAVPIMTEKLKALTQ